MSYSKRQLYALGEPLGDSVTRSKVGGGRIYGGGGGGAPASGPTNTTVTNTNIPDYAQPYVSNMLNAAQAQIYTPDMTGFNPYTPYSSNPQDYVAGFSPLQQQAQSTAANMQVPGQYGMASQLAGTAGMGALGTVGQAGMYGGMGAQAGQQAAGMSNMYGGMGMMQGQQGANIGQSLGQMAQDPNAVQAYMNPYIQSSLNPQLAEIQRQYDITGTQEQSAATQGGAFGGSREALMAAENQRNAGLAKNQAIGQGYNQAFTNAQQQMQAANQAALAGNAQAQQGISQGLTGAGQAGSQSMQGYGMGLTGAGQAANLGMQGAQAGLQGVGAQQAGYGQAGTAGSNLANIGGQQLAAQQGIMNAQNTMGAQQQTNQQNVINQAVQNYATAQQYPMLQLGMLNSMLRGLPMQQSSTQMYQAAPNTASQLAGLGTAGLGLAAMSKAGGAASGGLGSDIAKYAPGGAIPMSMMSNQQLQGMQKSQAATPMQKLIAPGIVQENQRIQANPEAAKMLAQTTPPPQMPGGMPPPQQVAQMPQTRTGLGAIGTGDMVPEHFASGGIMSFADEGQVPEAKTNPVDDALAMYADKSGKVDLNKAALALLGQAQTGEQTISPEREQLLKGLESQHENQNARLLTKMGIGMLQGTSQYALPNIGNAAASTMASYEKDLANEQSVKQQLAKLDAEGATKDDARRLSLAGTLLQIQNNRDMKMAALANAPSAEDRNVNRAMTLINNDPQIKKYVAQQKMLSETDPQYQVIEQRIAERQNQIYHTAGVKVPEVTPSKIPDYVEPEKPGFFSGLFGSSKPAASAGPKVVPFSQLPT